MVIALHIPSPRGTILFSFDDNINAFFDSISFCAVNVFALISGYLLSSKKTTTKKLLNIWAQIFFYSMINLLLFATLDCKSIGIAFLFKSFFPVLSGFQWYATSYVAMYVFLPYFNELISKIGLSQTKKMVWGILLIFGVGDWIGQCLGGGKFLGVNNGYSVVWLSVLFLVGASLKNMV